MVNTLQYRFIPFKKEKKQDTSLSCHQAVKEVEKNVNENLCLLGSIYDRLNYLSDLLSKLDGMPEKIVFEKNTDKENKEKGK